MPSSSGVEAVPALLSGTCRACGDARTPKGQTHLVRVLAAVEAVMTRGKCGACGYRIRLRADGSLGTHRLWQGSQFQYVCAGTGGKPVDDANPDGFSCHADPNYVCDGTCPECEVNQ